MISKLMGLVTGIMAAIALFFKVKADSTRNKAQKEKIDKYEEVIDDVETARRTRADDNERMRVEDKYTRK